MSGGDAVETEKKVHEEGVEATKKEISQVIDPKDSTKVVARGIQGTVKWFSLKGRFGTITREDTGEEVFVHLSSVTHSTKERHILEADMKVEFSVISSKNRPEAVAVTLPGGLPIDSTRVFKYSSRRVPKQKNGVEKNKSRQKQQVKSQAEENNGK